MNRIDLYRARYKRWRSSPGTIEWHRAVADIREYSGDVFPAAVHRFVASIKEALKPIAEAFGEVVDVLAEGRERVLEIQS